MKKSLVSAVMLGSLPAALLFVSCSSPTPKLLPDEASSSSSYVTGVAGGQQVNTIKVKAKVVAIDKKQRVATLERADGQSYTVAPGPEAVNFDQIAVGDTVEVAAARSVLVRIAAKAADASEGAGVMVAGAPAGSAPAGIVAGVVQFTGTVAALDGEQRTARLRFEDGSDCTLSVRPDVDMTQYKLGDKVVFQVAGAITIEVIKP